MLLALLEPIVAEVIEAPTRETTVADVVLQALGITGVILVGALIAGLSLAGLFIWMRSAKPDNRFNGTGSERLRLDLEPPRT